MKKLHFRSAQEFEGIFQRKTKEITDSIVDSIEQALASKHRTANIFEISFDESDIVFEISLPKNQWATALQSCLDHYHSLELVDEQIDTWRILESVKKK